MVSQKVLKTFWGTTKKCKNENLSYLIQLSVMHGVEKVKVALFNAKIGEFYKAWFFLIACSNTIALNSQSSNFVIRPETVPKYFSCLTKFNVWHRYWERLSNTGNHQHYVFLVIEACFSKHVFFWGTLIKFISNTKRSLIIPCSHLETECGGRET